METASASITGSTSLTPPGDGSNAWKGFVFPWRSGAFYEHTDIIGQGLYKVTYVYDLSDSPGTDYFYIDLRDCRYDGPGGIYGLYGPDFHLRFNYLTEPFYYGPNWLNTISKGEVFRVWEYFDVGNPNTYYFEDFWDNALVITNNGSNKPQLVWSSHPTFSATHYKIYRALSNNPANPLTLNYTNIYTTNSSTYSWADPEMTFDASPDKYAYYYVKGYNSVSSTYSGRTNIEEVEGDYSAQKQIVTYKSELEKFELNQSYPNPFNPTTKINYQTAEDAKIQIKVYDMLGTEVAELVNEMKPAGYYEATFDASGLSSGIYIYRITATNGERILFNQSKQMMLVK